VLLVPGDTPLVESRDVGRLLALDTPVAIVPDRRGTGTNALLLAPPDAITPSFGPGSFARHVAAAHEAGVEHAVERISGLMFDIDTPDDLADLSTALDERRGHAPSTRGALRQLDRSRARASAARVAPASAY
jgi:2-phospho-L-lactate/phosphoenolpyruvate guanylyltransferase